VVGISGDCQFAVGRFSARHSVLWLNGHPLRLPTLGGRGWNTPMAINNLGTVVGFSDSPGDVVNGTLTPNFRAFVWSALTGIRKLPEFAGDGLNEALGINDFGQIVGVSFGGPNGSRGLLWQNGTVYDVNDLLPADSPLLVLAAGDINNQGEITGQACLVVGTACGTELHSFVAILTSGVGHDVGSQPARAERHIYVPPQLQAQIQRMQRLGRTAPMSPHPLP
jgi:probable HAF family extracellular repeat protein